MLVTTRKILLLLTLLLAFAGSGCRSSHSSEPEREEWNGDLMLVLRVYTTNPSTDNTRTLGQPDGYEYPVLATEMLNSLRVIIVNDNPGSDRYGRVIHNHCEYVAYPAEKYRIIKPFEVEFNTKYKIYLIGNEGGITGVDNLNYILNDSLAADKLYPAGTLENIIMTSSASGEPLINNSGNTSEQKYLPITEIFDITTMPRPITEVEATSYTDERNFFLTRTASKFSFRFYRGGDISNANLSVKAIKISGLGRSEYLFPNATTYSPAKYNADGTVNTTKERYITSYALPPSAVAEGTGDYTFTVPNMPIQSLPVVGSQGSDETAANLFAPQIYFPESNGATIEAPFQCSISFDGVTFTPAVTLPNLELLPRNTHVRINITFHEIGFVVNVVRWVLGGQAEIEMDDPDLIDPEP